MDELRLHDVEVAERVRKAKEFLDPSKRASPADEVVRTNVPYSKPGFSKVHFNVLLIISLC